MAQDRDRVPLGRDRGGSGACAGHVLGTLHPAAIERQWMPWRPLFDVDLRKAQTELERLQAGGVAGWPTREVTVVTTKADEEAYYDALWSNNDWVAVDIEGDHKRLQCLGVATSIDRAFVIPAENRWLVECIAESAVPKVLQNGQYDRFVLGLHGIDLKNQVFDTQLAWHALWPELAGQKIKPGGARGMRQTVKNLAFFASVYTRDPYWKFYDYADDAKMYELCGRDCCITLDVAAQMRGELEAV